MLAAPSRLAPEVDFTTGDRRHVSSTPRAWAPPLTL